MPSSRPKRPKGERVAPIEIRDRRIRGGRLSISPRTRHGPTRTKRKAALHGLLDAGRLDLIEQLRARKLDIREVQAAWEAGDLGRLTPRAPAPAAEGVLSLGEALSGKLRSVEATRAEGTAKHYRTLQRTLLARFGEHADLREIGRAEVEAYLHELKARRGAPSRPWGAGRQEVMRAVGGAVWEHAIEAERERAARGGDAPRLTLNPWKVAETRGERTKRVAWLRPEEWRVLASKVEGRKEAALLALGALAGLRMREALHLRPGLDIDLERGVLRIQPRGGSHPWQPKTDRSVRDVPIGMELRRVLEYHLEHYAGDRYLIRLPGRDEPIHPTTAQKWVGQAFAASGIAYGREGDGLTYHDLRHTFASWLVQRDVQLKKVAELLGNTIQEVDRTYSHLAPTDLSAAVALVDRIATGEEHET